MKKWLFMLPNLVNNQWAALILPFCLMTIYIFINQNLPFRGDAYEIWEVAKVFYDENRSHSFVEYRGPFTFVFFNLIYEISSIINLDDVLFLRVSNSLFFALFCGILVPRLMSFVLGKKASNKLSFIFSIIIFYFFSGYFLYPSTDFIALFFLVISINISIFPATISLGKIYRLVFLSGVFLACAAMIRVNYIVSFPIILILLLYSIRERRNIALITSLILIFSIPFFSLLSVNSAATHPAKINNVGLLKGQLMGGLKAQRIEWNAGDMNYPGHLTFPESRGREILIKEGYEVNDSLIGSPILLEDYFSLFIKYPVDMISILSNHLFNGLDITYNSVYVYDFSSSRLVRSLLNYCLLFLAVLAIYDKSKNKTNELTRSYLLILAMSLPGFSSTPFVGEVRFFIPIIITYIAIAIFSSDDIINRPNRWWTLTWMAVFVVFAFMHSALNFSGLDKVILLNGHP